MTRLDDGAIRLRSGYSVWQAHAPQSVATERADGARQLTTDIAIVGAGITGAFLAEKFTRAGRRVVMIDRRAPATGSTAASTAMLLWELDASLLELEDRMGFEAAARVAGACRRQVAGIAALVNETGIDCGLRPCSSLYLAGDKLDAADLREEKRLRDLAGIEGRYLDAGELAAMGFVGDAALLYDGSADVDPVRLTRGLIAEAEKRGAIVLSPATAVAYESTQRGVTIETREGDVVRAGVLVLANGYEMPDFVPAARHALVSSWAIGSAAGQAIPWPDSPLIWEAADPYLYMRSTTDGRIVIGGEDEDFADADAREAMTAQKVEALLAKASSRCPELGVMTPEYAWSGVFGETDDSLPLIGRVPGRQSCLAAFGYGGNGITFSAMAADLLEAELSGAPRDDAPLFALDRG